ncbi:MAG: DoxX family protein [Pontiellaceae bacterium]|nr:DoxX family protein [Pontiellaceae bacterium]MBN2785646.1 DoxX family protein [Pontiellaceae bacterium]
MKFWMMKSPVHMPIPSVGLLLHRLVFGGFMLFGHGLVKLMSYSKLAESFPDPLGMGHQLSLISALFCEVICSACIMLGLGTRLVVLPSMFTMAVAAFVIHGGDPLFMGAGAAKEPALIYLSAYGLLLFTGAGRFSIDTLIRKRVGIK